ncbi:FabD/lysophospholipase-like protein, partial [Myriangium duriaei CBS 260.36]
MEGRRLNLLCIDGGGIKGLSALYIIRKLMEFIDHDNPPKPCKVFDMIGGTSTGGLIAVMLGRLDMTVDECIEQYRTLQNNVFHEMNKIERSSSTQGRYDHVALEEAVKVLLRSRGRHENELLKNLDENGCKVFVTVTNSGSSTAEVIASYYRRRGSAEVWNIAKIWEAIRATSAAPDLFAPINIGIRRYLGGGTGANNPVSVMWREASDHFCSDGSLEDELNCLVSIGSGIKSLTRFGESTSALRRTLAAIATETEATARGFLDTRFALFDAGIYHRFSAPSVGDVAIEKPEDTSVVQMTDHYIS